MSSSGDCLAFGGLAMISVPIFFSGGAHGNEQEPLLGIWCLGFVICLRFRDYLKMWVRSATKVVALASTSPLVPLSVNGEGVAR